MSLLWLSAFLSFGSFFLLLTPIPLYAQSMGASESQVGLVLGIFALSAMCLRPLVGWQLDRGRRVMLFAGGAAIFAVAAAGYALVSGLIALLLLRIFHGTGMALGATAGPMLAGELAPPERRGEAVGHWGSAQSLASAIAPPAGGALAVALGYPPLFAVSAAIGALGFVAAVLITEPTRTATMSDGKLFQRRALDPGILAGASMLAYGAVAGFAPLYAVQHGLENPGFYFLVFAAAAVLGRIGGGRASDRVGRRVVVVPGLILVAAGVGSVPLFEGLALLVSAAVLGIGQGAVDTAAFALALDRVDPRERGSALGTVGTLLELGIGVGSIAAGFLAEAAGLGAAFVVIAAVPLLAGLAGLRLLR